MGFFCSLYGLGLNFLIGKKDQHPGFRQRQFTPTTPPIQLHKIIKISLAKVPAAAKLCSKSNPTKNTIKYIAMPQHRPTNNPFRRLLLAATNPAVKLPAHNARHAIACTRLSGASILLMSKENSSRNSRVTANPAKTANMVHQIGDCQSSRLTGRFLQGISHEWLPFGRIVILLSVDSCFILCRDFHPYAKPFFIKKWVNALSLNLQLLQENTFTDSISKNVTFRNVTID